MRCSFTTHQVAQVSGLSWKQLSDWDRAGVFQPSVQRSEGPGTRRLYSYKDLIQACLFRRMKVQGCTTQRVKGAIAQLRDLMETPDPLKVALITGGRSTVFAICRSKDGKRAIIDGLAAGGQQVSTIVLDTLEDETRQLLRALAMEDDDE